MLILPKSTPTNAESKGNFESILDSVHFKLRFYSLHSSGHRHISDQIPLGFASCFCFSLLQTYKCFSIFARFFITKIILKVYKCLLP